MVSPIKDSGALTGLRSLPRLVSHSPEKAAMITIVEKADSRNTTLTEIDRPLRVYTEFFGLREVPFSITPDPDFLFLSGTHREVLEKIQYGIDTRMGFMLLTGEVGTGKTTLCRALLDRLQGRCGTVYIINPSLSGEELIGAILDDLGVERIPGRSKKGMIDQLNWYLLANALDHPVVIIIDDAQTMPLPTFEDLRLLSNLETDKQKLLQILMVGQPELLTILEQAQLRQLTQRVAVHCSLDYLSREEVGDYIQRRLFVAGNQGQIRFSDKVIDHIYRWSNGIPRMINKMCDLSLTAAYTENCSTITLTHLKAAVSEIPMAERMAVHPVRRLFHRFSPRWRRTVAMVIIVGVLAAGSRLTMESDQLPTRHLIESRNTL